MPKYRLTMNDIERAGGIAKLEFDGFKKEQIMKTMYKETEGLGQEKRTEIVEKLFNRQEPC